MTSPLLELSLWNARSRRRSTSITARLWFPRTIRASKRSKKPSTFVTDVVHLLPVVVGQRPGVGLVRHPAVPPQVDALEHGPVGQRDPQLVRRPRLGVGQRHRVAGDGGRTSSVGSLATVAAAAIA